MAFLSSMNIVGSGMTAQQLRLDVISENITNQNTTRTEGGGPYRRKIVVFEAEGGERSPFQQVMARIRGEDPSDFKLMYDPTNPDANADGYVEMPNVDLVKEMADAMAASQAYSANVTAFNVLKQVASKGLEIGK